MIETLFGLVKEGRALLAVVWKPFWMNDWRVGRMLDWSPLVRYDGSKPSTHITTVGWRGRTYSRECRVILGWGSDNCCQKCC